MMAFLNGLFDRPPAKRKAKGKAANTGLAAQIVLAGDRLAFSWKVRQGLYRHLAAQVSNGVAVETALDTYRSRLKRRRKVSSDKIVGDVARRMRDGKSLAAAMTKWVPADELGVIESGEVSGNLAAGLELIIDAKRRLDRVKKALKSALVTPAVYMAAVMGLLFGIGRMIPDFQRALPRDKASGMVTGLYVAGDFATSFWMFLPLIILAGIVAAVVYSLPRWTGNNRIKAEGIFPYSFYRDMNGYTWLMGFAALLKAGQPDVEILQRQLKTASPWLRERLHSVWWRMDNGDSLGEALMAKGKNGQIPFGFPNPDIIDDIESTSGFSDFPDRIVTIASQWADDLESSTLEKARLFGLYAELFMYLLMGLLMVAINAMSTQLGSVTAM